MRRKTAFFRKIMPHGLLAVAAFSAFCSACRPGAVSRPERSFTRSEAMVSMRDGVRLYTEIYSPASAGEALPILLTRTPYGTGGPDRWNPKLKGEYRELADEGYIFVFQDIRGRYRSEGRFVMMRPPRDKADPGAFDEGTDAYDTIAWLLKNVPGNNGRVGMLGISYPGWLTVMALLDPHPALRAASPQASPADMYLGDDFHHNGAFRLSYGLEYAAMMETSKVNTSFRFDTYDTFEWYLRLGPLSNANDAYFHGTLPTWNDFVAHPDYDAFWRRLAVTPYLTRLTVPTLNVAGWWDQEDFYGPLKIYATLEKNDQEHRNFFVAGPWNHGGWASPDGSHLGQVKFASNTSRYFREKVQAPWFAYFLKDKGRLDLPEALMFETGSNRWMSYDEWPPRHRTIERRLYFRGEGRLSFDPPPEDGEEAADSYVSDPDHPVPYRPRPVEPTYDPKGSGWYTWQVQDQRFAHLRPDVLSWQTEPLRDDVVIAGDISAHLFASTTGSDSDWVVKLIDVYPEDEPQEARMGGYQLMIAGDVLRGRFRTSFENPEPIRPGEVREYVVDLHQNDHSFLKGHKIMVQVQSTWFPLIDRNPQTYVRNIFLAQASDYQSATQRIFRSKGRPSHMDIAVLMR